MRAGRQSEGRRRRRKRKGKGHGMTRYKSTSLARALSGEN